VTGTGASSDVSADSQRIIVLVEEDAGTSDRELRVLMLLNESPKDRGKIFATESMWTFRLGTEPRHEMDPENVALRLPA
jgi:hypothetical protein